MQRLTRLKMGAAVDGNCGAHEGAHNNVKEKQGQSKRIWGKGSSQILPAREQVGTCLVSPLPAGSFQDGRLKGRHCPKPKGLPLGSVPDILQM